MIQDSVRSGFSGAPIVTELQVIPVAGRDSMLLNLSGAHGPFFTRNIVILRDSAGHTGVGEVPGGESIRKTIDDARPLVVGQSIGNLHAVLNRLSLRQRPPLQNRAQSFAFQQLGHQERRRLGTLALGPDVMNRQNIWMVQRRHCPRFLLKPPQPLRLAGKGLRQNLERNLAPKAGVFGAIHFTHPASA